METEPENRSHLCDTHREEVASVVAHAVGIAFGVGALVTMVVLAWEDVFKINVTNRPGQGNQGQKP